MYCNQQIFLGMTVKDLEHRVMENLTLKWNVTVLFSVLLVEKVLSFRLDSTKF